MKTSQSADGLGWNSGNGCTEILNKTTPGFEVGSKDVGAR
jgi:hypothetical protein